MSLARFFGVNHDTKPGKLTFVTCVTGGGGGDIDTVFCHLQPLNLKTILGCVIFRHLEAIIYASLNITTQMAADFYFRPVIPKVQLCTWCEIQLQFSHLSMFYQSRRF